MIRLARIEQRVGELPQGRDLLVLLISDGASYSINDLSGPDHDIRPALERMLTAPPPSLTDSGESEKGSDEPAPADPERRNS